MKYGSVCSGIEAATVAWHDLGWDPAWFCEYAPFPSAVLKHHFPGVINFHDMLHIEKKGFYHDRPIDLLVGGTPCQSFSVAGLRGGLDDARGNLALKFCQILRDKQPRWFIWENVPGVLSTSCGGDFSSILSGFRECGYGFAYRILDAQYFGVPQRRRRIFVIGYLGDWRPPASVLFERESLYGYPEPSRPKKSRIAGGDGKNSEVFCIQGNVIGRGKDAGPNGIGVQKDLSYTLNATDHHVVCFEPRTPDGYPRVVGDLSPTLRTKSGGQITPCIYNSEIVRKLTPREYERLMGFPDDWTLVPYRGKPATDGPRYTALGNSMAVPVMRWLGWRVDTVDKLLLSNAGLFEMSRHDNLSSCPQIG